MIMEKSIIYEIKRDSCLRFILVNHKQIFTEFNKHLAHFKYNRPKKSNMADHIFQTKNKLKLNMVKLNTKVTSDRLRG